jgi:Family of unknown function (DUF5924)/Protein of unknown function (DUF2914)
VTALGWLRRWGLSLASLIGGLLTLSVFRREITHVQWIVGYLLLLWVLWALLVQLRDALESSPRRLHRVMVTAADYTLQSLYHGVLLFLLPAYWASTTLASANAVFFGLLVALAVVATFDPWYRAMVERPAMGYVFFLVSMFGALNLALPLIGLPPSLALFTSAVLAVVALTPAVRRARAWTWPQSLAVASSAALLAGVLVLAGGAWIPPAPLSLARATLAWDAATLDSLEPVPSAISAEALRRHGLIAYTNVYAPAGLRQSIRHVWRREGTMVDVVALSPVRGGRREGFRTFSRKTAFPGDPTGRWSVDVVTGSGQLIGRLRFRVIP